MNHIDFAIWMVGYPLVLSITWLPYRYFNNGKLPPEMGFEAIVKLAYWIGIGALIWNG